MANLRHSWVSGLTALACVVAVAACASGKGDGDSTADGDDGDSNESGAMPTESDGNMTGNNDTPAMEDTPDPVLGDDSMMVVDDSEPVDTGDDAMTDSTTPKCDATMTPAVGTCNVVDDFEDGAADSVGGRMCPTGDGRGPGGSWDIVRPDTLDSMYEFVPVTDGAPGSTQGIHWAATGVDANQGASIGLSFGPCYGAAPMYSGVTFWAKATEPVDLIAGVNDALSHGEVDCHGADSAEPGPDACYGSFRKTVSVTDTWQQFTVTWDELVQASWGTPQHPLEPNKLVSLVFISLTDFDLMIDDIEFIGGDSTTCGAAAVPEETGAME